MDLPDIKDLGKVIDLCRKKGVKTFQIGELKFELGEDPAPRRTFTSNETEKPEIDPNDPWAQFPAGELSNEQLAYYSSGGMPGKEPWMNKGEPE